MNVKSHSPVTAQAEQATVHETVVSNNNGMEFQGSANSDCNRSVNNKIKENLLTNCVLSGENMGTENNTYYFPTVEELLEMKLAGVVYQNCLLYTSRCV